jgi:hypothetical protein
MSVYTRPPEKYHDRSELAFLNRCVAVSRPLFPLPTSRLLKKSSAACSPSVISPASGRELEEGSQLYRRGGNAFLLHNGFSAPC